MNIDVDTSDLDRLARDLVAAGPKVQKVSGASLTKIAKQLQQDARAAAPVDTGALQESIKVRGGKDFRVVYSDLRYSTFVEFGTSDTAPQPYLWPQARTAQERLAEALERGSDPLT